ncbi:hypothetical protein NS506_02225 [Nocardia seriolae]|uniref:Transposase n=1 Tax=Nocardia seriolae TaxID=37332 RepID=A0ABC9Z1V4_9NOCA|nr:hypothetical protein NS506_02225 [Nocardia seriolae]GEM27342.1 hypothetical protein NS2_55810 [Nocardia seriolae NBRC 15557]PSK28188.1 hypothetical protein C6575_27975 [Nocardia seriolae]RLP28799.1 hypothetical protein D6158_27555 [Nocardia seriolae]BEK85795.1 hypothetical protein NSERKGN1266_17460 [Nocardia seriolae]
MISKLSSPVRWEAEWKRTSTPLEPRRSADPTSWLTGYHRLNIRYDRKATHYLAFLTLAAVLTGYKKLARSRSKSTT